MATLTDIRRKVRNISNLTESPLAAKESAESLLASCQEFTWTKSSECNYFASLILAHSDSSLFGVIKPWLWKSALADCLKICVDAIITCLQKLPTKTTEQYCVELWNFGVKICQQESLKSNREIGFVLVTLIMEQLKVSEYREDLAGADLVKWCYAQMERLSSQTTSTVRKGIFQLIGALCKYMPQDLRDVTTGKNYAVTFATVLAKELKNQMTSTTKSPVYTVLEGCFVGLNGLISNFHDVFDSTHGKLTMRGLYDYCKKALEPTKEVSRRGFQRAALDLLVTHATLFQSYFYAEYRILFECFHKWSVYSDRDLRNLGLQAVEVLTQMVSKELVANIAQHRNEAETVYNYFVQTFRSTLLRSNSAREAAMSAKGYATFAAACKALHGQELVNQMLLEVSSRCEEVFFTSSDPLEQKVTYIPMFLESFALILAVTDEVNITVWLPIETLHVLLFQHFPLMDSKYHYRSALISYRLFFAAAARNQRYIDQIVFQAFTRIFSLLPVALLNAEDNDEPVSNLPVGQRDARKTTYIDYLPFWRLLLQSATFKSLDEFGISNDSKRTIRDEIYAAIIKAFLEFLDKLDFTTTNIRSFGNKDDQDQIPGISSDPMSNIKPSKTIDIWILVNLSDFAKELFPSVDNSMFKDWLLPLSLRLMDLSTRYPLMSGFYKLLTLCLNIANGLKLFSTSDSSVKKCYDHFALFIEDASLRVKQFKDELFTSCLELVLSLPPEMVSEKLNVLGEVIADTLKLGLSFLPLADKCIGALERWNKYEPPINGLNELYATVLPCFDEYLRTKTSETDENVSVAAGSVWKTPKKLSRTQAQRKNLKFRMQSSRETKNESLKLQELNRRIVVFIGNLGGEINKHLVDRSYEDIAKSCVVWDTNTQLKFSVPFLDMKPDINLDVFLPRLCDLASSSGNRQTKIAACESLHSIILYLLGKSATITSGSRGEKVSYSKLYDHLFPVTLGLCCDADEVPKQLFRTLFTQIIHWFSSNQTQENPEMVSLVNALMRGVVSGDAGLRDYSAESFNEFLLWSIKHSVSDQKAMKANFYSLIKRLYSFATHSSSIKRLGAALVFNSIYRTFREEQSLIDEYLLEIFAVYMRSLALSDMDDDGYGTSDQLIKLINHIDRVVVRKAELLNRNVKSRKVPSGWSSATLKACVDWLFQQIGRPQEKYRQRSFELLRNWCSLCGYDSFKSYVVQWIQQNSLKDLFLMFENGGVMEDLSSGIRAQPTIDFAESTFTEICAWLHSLEASLDCYHACLMHSVINPKDINAAGDTKIIKSVCHFIGYVLQRKSTPGHRMHSSSQQRSFKRLIGTVCVRILRFLEHLLNQKEYTVLPLAECWPLLIQCCFSPSTLGFDMTHKDTAENLPKLLEQVLRVVATVSKQVSAPFLSSLQQICEKEFPFSENILENTNDDWFSLNERFRGYELMFSAGIKMINRPPLEKFWKIIADASFVSQSNKPLTVRKWTGNALSIARDVLKLAAVVTHEVDDVMEILLDKTLIASHNDVTQFYTKGCAFLDLFPQQVALFACRNVEKVVANLKFVSAKEPNSDFLGDLIVKLTETIGRTRQLRKHYGSKWVSSVSASCSEYFRMWISATERSRYTWVNLVQKFLLIDVQFLTTPIGSELCDMFVTLLSSKSDSFRFKNKLLILLGPFAKFTAKRDAIRDALNQFCANNFPFHSTEFEIDTPQRDEYLTALRRLIYSLSISDSSDVLQILIEVLSRDAKHIAEAEIIASLANYCSKLPPSKYEDVVSVPFKFFFQTSSVVMDEHRLNSLSKFLMSMLSGFDDNLLATFFMKHIKTLLNHLEDPLDRTREPIYGTQIVTRLGCLQLLELMYNRLDISILKGAINNEYVGNANNDKTELIKKIAKVADEARKETGNDHMSNVLLQYRCSAHNTLIAMVSKTQTQAKFFDNLIFKHDSRSLIWESIFDQNVRYDFAIELENALGRKSRSLILLRRSRHIRDSAEIEASFQGNSNLQFLSSQFLADSSLNSELNEYDFTTSTMGMSMRDDSSYSQITDAKASSSTTAAAFDTEGNANLDFALEEDELNSHPCMEPMLNLIQHLTAKEISPVKPNLTMPDWMRYMLDVMKEDGKSYCNAKLFITRIVTLMDNIFSVHAPLWMQLLLKFLLSSSFGSEGLHYFRVDLIITLLRWSKNEAFEIRRDTGALLSDTFRYCVMYSRHENNRVFQRNLRLLNMMLSIWKKWIVVDPIPIIELLESVSDANIAKISAGIQILGVVLSNGVNPFGIEGSEQRQNIYGSLKKCLLAKSAKISTPAAEVIGLTLRFLSTKKDGPAYEQIVVSQMKSFAPDQNPIDRAKFVQCLHSIQRHYQQFADYFMTQIISWLPQMHGGFKANCLEIIYNGCDSITNLYSELRARGLENILISGDEQSRLWVAKILEKIVENLSEQQLKEVIPWLNSFLDSQNTEYRRALAEFCIRVYDMGTAKDNSAVEGPFADAKGYLLGMLNDPDPGLKTLIYNFWLHETRLSTTTSRRLLNILRDTYTEMTEKEFLSHATYFLLELTSKSPDYMRAIFDVPLHQCRFEDLRIPTSYKRRYATWQTPAFTDNSTMSQEFLQKFPMLLKATQRSTMEFSATAAFSQAGSKTFDWVTGQSYDTFADVSMMSSELDESKLLFAKKLTQRAAMTNQPKSAVMDSSMLASADEGEELSLLKRRIVKDANKASASQRFARIASRREQMRQKTVEERKKAREQNVQLHRTFRHGDYPDVQIMHSAMIAPLQAVAQHDSIIAGFLFAALADGIFEQIHRGGDESELDNMRKSMIESIEDIMYNSTEQFKPLMSSLLTLCFRRAKYLQLDTGILTNTSIIGRQQNMGIVLLEKYIEMHNDADDERERCPKRRKVTEESTMDDNVVDYWTKLARLYKSLENHDAIKVIFGETLQCSQSSQDALTSERDCDYSRAITLYTTSLRSLDSLDVLTSVQDAEVQLCEESRLKCLHMLNNWKSLSSVTTRLLDDAEPPDFDRVWSDPYYQYNNFPLLLKSKLYGIITECIDPSDSFIQTLNAWNKNDAKRKWLEGRHADLLAVFSISKRDYTTAEQLCIKTLNQFLLNWCNLSITDQSLRKHYLESLQLLSEMSQFVALVNDASENVNLLYTMEHTLEKWERHTPSVTADGTETWYQVYTNRALYAEQLAKQLNKRGVSDASVYPIVCRFDFRAKLACLRNALHKRNYATAFAYLDEAQASIKGFSGDDNVTVQWANAYGLAQLTVANQTLSSSVEIVEKLMKGLEVVDAAQGKGSLESQTSRKLLEGRLLEALGLFCMAENLNVQQLDSSTKNFLTKRYTCDGHLSSQTLLSNALARYESAKSGLTGDNQTLFVESHLAVAEYCDKIIRKKHENLMPDDFEMRSYPETFTENALIAMKLGSAKSRQLFPHIMHVLELYENAISVFNSKVKDIPCWMFLPWLSQITATLNKPVSENFHSIIEQIADSYPEALVYPFCVSASSYAFENDPKGIKRQQFVEKIREKMNNLKGVMLFIRALFLVSTPDYLVKEFREYCQEIYKKKSSQTDKTASATKLQALYRTMFLTDYNSNEYGEFWKDFIAEFQPKFDEQFGVDCALLTSISAEKMRKIEHFYGMIYSGRFHKEVAKSSRQINAFSMWLSSYDPMSSGLQLEIPGQYSGNNKPLIEYHTKIVGFDPEITPMSSLRRPFKLTIRGNNGSEYGFLMKTGEDIRQDERIERLFVEMNNLFNSDSEATGRSTAIKTYNVIPLTDRGGLIGFVPNVKSLIDFINLGDDTDKRAKSLIGISEGPGYMAYRLSYRETPHAVAVKSMLKAQAEVPRYLLRDAILNMCASPESFYILRSQFITSYGTMCIANYILGIGDRHLQNILIDTTSATVVGIDFGLSFGAGLELPVPELMPFRLTSQFVNLCDPVGVHGQLESVMQCCLRVLRENRAFILNLMNIFVNEPLLNWQREAQRRTVEQNEKSSEASSLAWHPASKLGAATRKLAGVNPVTVMESELCSLKHDLLDKLLEVIYGKRDGSEITDQERLKPRGFLKEGLDIRDQVRCLINMASDPLVLARTFIGYRAYV